MWLKRNPTDWTRCTLPGDISSIPRQNGDDAHDISSETATELNKNMELAHEQDNFEKQANNADSCKEEK